MAQNWNKFLNILFTATCSDVSSAPLWAIQNPLKTVWCQSSMVLLVYSPCQYLMLSWFSITSQDAAVTLVKLQLADKDSVDFTTHWKQAFCLYLFCYYMPWLWLWDKLLVSMATNNNKVSFSLTSTDGDKLINKYIPVL